MLNASSSAIFKEASMMNDLTQTSFDYAALPAEVATKAQIAASNIKLRLKRTVEDIIEIGRELTAVKAELPHGQFEIWIKNEFQMNREMANNFIQVAIRFGGQMSDYLTFKPTVLYALAAPSTPESVVEKAIEKAESGEKVSVEWVKREKELEKALADEKRRSEEWRQQSFRERDEKREAQRQVDLLKSAEKPEPDSRQKIVKIDKIVPDNGPNHEFGAAQHSSKARSIRANSASTRVMASRFATGVRIPVPPMDRVRSSPDLTRAQVSGSLT